MKRIAVLAAAVITAFSVTAQAQEQALAGQIFRNAGAPVNGTNEIQTLTFGGTLSGGTFTLKVGVETTAAITWSSTNATLVSNIDTALEALPSLGSGAVTTAVGTMTSGVGTITVTFAGTNLAKRPVGVMTATSSMTGTAPTLVPSVTTAGVAPTGGTAAERGAILVNTSNGDGYLQQGAPPNVSWVKFSP